MALSLVPRHQSDTVNRRQGPILLVVDDEPHSVTRLELALSQSDTFERLAIFHASRISQALEILSANQVHVALVDKHLDIGLGHAENGIDGIPEMLKLQPHLQIVVLTGSRDIPDVVKAMNFGAFNYVTKETPDDLLIKHLERAVQVSLLELEKERSSRKQDTEQNRLVGRSKAFRETIRTAADLVETDRPVLLTGETGTGKTELAKWIHDQRTALLDRKDHPFQAINVATLSRGLIESELFGHEKGAFTDAKQLKRGHFEIAQNGTLFLDEIGEMPLDLQAKLLTVIEQGTFMRVGGSQPLKSFPKVILATHRNLAAMVEEGTFRSDLYHRISSFHVHLPSLRERKEDIADIVEAMLPKAARVNRVEASFEEIPKEFIDYLGQIKIEGNIRGIWRYLERLLVHAPRDKNGRRVFCRWKEIPGLYQGSDSSQSLHSPSLGALTYGEVMNRPWNFIENEFPGFEQLLETFKIRVLTEAVSKYNTKREMAKALGLRESTFCMISKRFPEISKLLKEKKTKGMGSKRSTYE